MKVAAFLVVTQDDHQEMIFLKKLCQSWSGGSSAGLKDGRCSKEQEFCRWPPKRPAGWT
jgi:hypothetical protein